MSGMPSSSETIEDCNLSDTTCSLQLSGKQKYEFRQQTVVYCFPLHYECLCFSLSNYFYCFVLLDYMAPPRKQKKTKLEQVTEAWTRTMTEKLKEMNAVMQAQKEERQQKFMEHEKKLQSSRISHLAMINRDNREHQMLLLDHLSERFPSTSLSPSQSRYQSYEELPSYQLPTRDQTSYFGPAHVSTQCKPNPPQF